MNIFGQMKLMPEDKLREFLGELELVIDRQKEYEQAMDRFQSYIKELDRSTPIDTSTHMFNELKLSDDQASKLLELVEEVEQAARLKGDMDQLEHMSQFKTDFTWYMPYGAFNVYYPQQGS